MSVATLAALNAKLYNGSQRVVYARAVTNVTSANGGSLINSPWVSGSGLQVGAVPTAAAVCDRTTQGGLHSCGWQNKIATEQRLWLERFDTAYPSTIASVAFMLVDRLAHVGGFDGTLTTAQSNGAWPALPRSTNGVGVWAGVEIYTSVGATFTTATVSYTNDAGGASTSPVFDFGGAGRNAVGRINPIPLANGDKGVKAITSATLAASSGTAGNWGVTLFKTYGVWHANNSGIPVSHSGRPFPSFGPMPAIPDGACLQLLCVTGFAATVTTAANVRAFED